MRLISSYTVPSDTTTYTFNDVGTYDDLFIVLSARGYGSAGTDRDAIALRFNGASTVAYTYMRGYQIGGSTTRGSDSDTADRLLLGYIPGRAAGPSNVYSATTIYIPQYRSTAAVKTLVCDSVAENTTSGANGISYTTGAWNDTAAISSITFGIWDGFGSFNIVAGSTFSIYGINT
jgi:hypothetical protein